MIWIFLQCIPINRLLFFLRMRSVWNYGLIFQVYLINLKRRADRRDRMLRSLEVLGIDVTITDAVDGKYDVVNHWMAITYSSFSYSMWAIFHSKIQLNSVSSRALNSSQLRALGIEMLPAYKDPYSERVLTKGEIGCFLSHYNIWKKVHLLVTVQNMPNLDD